MKSFFMRASGGKTIFVMKRVGIFSGGLFIGATVLLAWLGPARDRTEYLLTSRPQTDARETKEMPGAVSNAVASLFKIGKQRKEEDQKRDAAKRRHSVAIKYFAPQIVVGKSTGPKSIRSGSKLVGFLMTAIDTRSSSVVRVRVPRGGEAAGIEMERGSILSGQYSYSGSGERVSVVFNRLDKPDGETKKFHAQALDTGTYTSGITGEVFSDRGAKRASGLGLTMFSGMADVLTEKESLGFSQNGVQAKSTMKNALLQGLSRSAQEETALTASEIEGVKDYVLVPEGKEMIIELTEDFK